MEHVLSLLWNTKVKSKTLSSILYRNLPQELIQIILSYCDVIVYRNGMYMNRIPRTDLRYKMLSTIPKPSNISTVYLYGHTIIDFIKLIFNQKHAFELGCYELTENNKSVLEYYLVKLTYNIFTDRLQRSLYDSPITFYRR